MSARQIEGAVDKKKHWAKGPVESTQAAQGKYTGYAYPDGGRKEAIYERAQERSYGGRGGPSRGAGEHPSYRQREGVDSCAGYTIHDPAKTKMHNYSQRAGTADPKYSYKAENYNSGGQHERGKGGTYYKNNELETIQHSSSHTGYSADGGYSKIQGRSYQSSYPKSSYNYSKGYQKEEGSYSGHGHAASRGGRGRAYDDSAA